MLMDFGVDFFVDLEAIFCRFGIDLGSIWVDLGSIWKPKSIKIQSKIEVLEICFRNMPMVGLWGAAIDLSVDL